ncbi:MAG: type II toxin-antitoxin system HipA family toxin [Alphaproteobacteria bacterium]
MAELPVYYEARRVGGITSAPDGATFTYDADWLTTRGAFPLSVLMPLSPAPVPPAIFLPWAANLLPEAGNLAAISLHLGAARDDIIAILAAIGRDTAGALSIGKPGTVNAGNWKPVRGAKALERVIEELPAKPFLVGDEGVSMSLAGAQTKLGVAVNEAGQICIPVDGAPSTHILKPDAERLYGSVQNEALCLVLAGRCGLGAPAVTTGKAGKRSYALITRYDRIQRDGRWRRLHQEDYCQALGKPPAAKYEANQTGVPGPKLADMFALTRRIMQAPDVLALLDQAVFNILVCNTDAHAKNYSIMITANAFRLAPIYDVMCAAAWDGVTRNLAQKIAGKNRGDHLQLRHWQRLAADCELNAPRLLARVRELARAVLRELQKAADEVASMPAGSHPLMPEFCAAIAARTRNVLGGLSNGE